MKRVLVTGGNGFIGRYLCRDLAANGYEITTFDRRASDDRSYRAVEGDVRDIVAVRSAVRACDGVFHLAGLVGTSYLETHAADAVEVNVRGAVNIFDAALDSGAFVVNIGLVPDWLNAYMITKKTAARFGQMYHQIFGARIATLEFSHVYGPGQPTGPYEKAIPTFICKGLAGQPMNVYGTGERTMDCIYVEDAVRSMRLAAESDQAAGQVIQIMSGETISVLELANTIRDLIGSKSEIIHSPMRQGEPAEVSQDERVAAKSPACNNLGWRPTISLTEGLEKTIEYYRTLRSD